MATHAVSRPIQLPSPFGSLVHGNAIPSISTVHVAQSAFDPAYRRELADRPVLARATAAGW
jgi:hypothetical protein